MEVGREASLQLDCRIDGADTMRAVVGLDGALGRVLHAMASADRSSEEVGGDAGISPAQAADDARGALEGVLVTLPGLPAPRTTAGSGATGAPAGRESALGVVDDVVRRLLVAAVAAHDAAGAAADGADEVIAQIDGALRALRVGALTGAFPAAG